MYTYMQDNIKHAKTKRTKQHTNPKQRNINIDVVGAWTETVTQNKTESAKIHQMNAEEQDINGNTINLN